MLDKIANLTKMSFKNRLTLYFAVVICFTLFGSTPFKIPFMLTFIPLAILFVIVVSKNLIYPSIKIMLSYQTNKKSMAPEYFQTLATKMGTCVKTIKIIESKKTNAYAFPGGIAFTKKMLDNFTQEEKAAVLAHEIAHKKESHLVYRALIVIFPAMIISNIWSRFTTPVIFNLTVTGIIFGLMMGLALLALIISLMIPINWILEFRADITAAKAVGAEHVKSALLKLTEKEKIMFHSETHPSTYERIKHIESKN